MEKKKFRLNVIDCVIIVAVLAIAAYGGYRYFRSGGTIDPPTRTKYVMVLDQMDIADDAFGNGKVKIGSKVTERTVQAFLGKVTNIESVPSRAYAQDSDGNLTLSPRPLYSHLKVTIEGEAVFASSGGITINGLQFLCNKQYEIIIDDSLFYLRILELERIEDN